MRQIRIVKELVEQKFLPFVRRPSRYIGGEVNQIKKDLNAVDVTVGLCFPDIYEIGMSYTGMAVLYEVVNRLDWAAAERVFAPWADAEQIMRDNAVPLYSLESMAAVADLDILGFSMTNEMCFTNVLNTLDLAGLPISSADRDQTCPLIIGGGQISNSAEPMSKFIDMFVLGEGEEALVKILELFRQFKQKGGTRKEFLIEAAKKFEFVYVSSLYEFEYDGEKIRSFKAKQDDFPTSFKNAIVEDLDTAAIPLSPIVPFAEAVHERVCIEIMRGCPGRCRFCQASFCRRPIRFRSVDKIIESAKEIYDATGFDTVSLLSLSTADYPDLEELVVRLKKYFDPKRVGLSLPSLRVKEQLELLPKLITSVRKGGLTIAVEAANEKLRKVINKPITNADLFAAVEAAYKEGYQLIKLYFMVGFPGESEDDIRGIVDLSYEIARLRRKIDNKTANVNVAVSWLVPKSHTPFGWLGQKDKNYFENAKSIILKQKRELKAKFLKFKFHNIETSILESCMGTADRRMCDVIETAWKNGAKFDLWTECFNYDIWKKAFAAHGLDPEVLAQRSYEADEILPWQHLGMPDKKSLVGHFKDAMDIAGQPAS
jgi:radical SAM family uncharacterized protein